MSNPSKQKGTHYETEKIRCLQHIWPGLDHAKANNKSNDLIGAPFPIECKHRKVWAIAEWCRKVKAVAPGVGWLLLVAPGDRRTTASPPEVAVMPIDMAILLLQVAFDHEPEMLTEVLG